MLEKIRSLEADRVKSGYLRLAHGLPSMGIFSEPATDPNDSTEQCDHVR
jgi:hypothetical protein